MLLQGDFDPVERVLGCTLEIEEFVMQSHAVVQTQRRQVEINYALRDFAQAPDFGLEFYV
jgi:hypothetical protein